MNTQGSLSFHKHTVDSISLFFHVWILMFLTAVTQHAEMEKKSKKLRLIPCGLQLGHHWHETNQISIDTGLQQISVQTYQLDRTNNKTKQNKGFIPNQKMWQLTQIKPWNPEDYRWYKLFCESIRINIQVYTFTLFWQHPCKCSFHYVIITIIIDM